MGGSDCGNESKCQQNDTADLFVDFGELFQVVLQEHNLLLLSQAATLIRIQLYTLSEKEKKTREVIIWFKTVLTMANPS